MDNKMVNLETTNNSELNDLLNSFFIDGEIDNDGDLFIEQPVRLYINVEFEKKVLRLYSFIHVSLLTKNKDSENIIKEFVDNRNKASYTVKYSYLGDESRSIMCEYGIPLNGCVDAKFLVKSIRHVESEILETSTTISAKVNNVG